MNTLLLFTVLFAGACMADVSHILGEKPAIAILRSTQDATPDGTYQWAYETENGIAAQAEGLPSGESRGRYSYTAPNGEPIEVIWEAGPQGYVARGASIPETPAHVVRTLEYNAAHPYVEPTRPVAYGNSRK